MEKWKKWDGSHLSIKNNNLKINQLFLCVKKFLKLDFTLTLLGKLADWQLRDSSLKTARYWRYIHRTNDGGGG